MDAHLTQVSVAFPTERDTRRERRRPSQEKWRSARRCAKLQLVRNLLRRKPARWAIYTGTLVGGVLLLAAADAPESVVIGYLIALWALYMYLLRWRSR